MSRRRQDDDRQRLVAENMRLVPQTLKRLLAAGAVSSRARREYGDLLQEGVVALIEAARSHRRRHGAFAPFAMARIHYAISRYLHERGGLVRVPFITQRRRRGVKEETARDLDGGGAKMGRGRAAGSSARGVARHVPVGPGPAG